MKTNYLFDLNIAMSQIKDHLMRLSSNSNKIKSKQLEHLIGAGGETVRQIIHDLRLEGMPIASNSKGYWWANSASEMMKTIRQLQSRVNSMLDVIPILQNTMQRLPE